MAKQGNNAPLSSVPAPWRQLVLVCGKCMKRQSRETLRGELKRAIKHEGLRDIRVVVTGCMDLCPEDGVAVALGHELHGAVPRLHVLDNRAAAERLLPVLHEPRPD